MEVFTINLWAGVYEDKHTKLYNDATLRQRDLGITANNIPSCCIRVCIG